jgi:hypothetical protein
MKKYYKILYGLQSCNGGFWTWEQFKRTPTVKVKPCFSGWHITEKKNLIDWLKPDRTVYEVIPAKNRKIVNVVNKSVCCAVTLGKKIGTVTPKVLLELNRKSLIFAIRQFAKANVKNSLTAHEVLVFKSIADIIENKGRLRDKINKIKAMRIECGYNTRYRVDDAIMCLKYLTPKWNYSIRMTNFYNNAAVEAYNGNLILKTLREKGNV